jgi:hypothetical protein
MTAQSMPTSKPLLRVPWEGSSQSARESNSHSWAAFGDWVPRCVGIERQKNRDRPVRRPASLVVEGAVAAIAKTPLVAGGVSARAGAMPPTDLRNCTTQELVAPGGELVSIADGAGALPLVWGIFKVMALDTSLNLDEGVAKR